MCTVTCSAPAISLFERPSLARVAAEMRSEGVPVHYAGSLVMAEDEAVLCRFEGPSERAVAELNRRAGIAYDRIVPAVVVSPAVHEGA